MKISKKSQYALKAVFELAWRNGSAPVKTRDIADSQRMSPRFTEIILNELRHGGFVESRRGNEGGYLLAKKAGNLTMREIIECIEGPISVVPDAEKDDESSDFLGCSVFKGFWHDINNAIFEICEQKTFADMVELERAKRDKGMPNYNI